MINLKMSKKDKEKEYPVEATNIDIPDYPYGFCLSVDNKYVEALGLSDVEAGTKVSISGVGKVVGVNIDESESDRTEHVRIQIQKIEVELDEDTEKRVRREVEKEVYGK